MSYFRRKRIALARKGIALAILDTLARCQSAYRSWAYARMLHVSNLSLGANPRVLGAPHISIGVNFIALDHLWLAAIESYGGRTYEPQVIIGNDVTVGDSVHIAAVHKVSIGDNVLMGSHILITDHNHGLYHGDVQTHPNIPPFLRPLGSSGSIWIDRNVWLGNGVVVLPNTTIGEGSSIGANSVVSGEIPKHCIAAGVPAKVIRTFDPLTNTWTR